MRNITLADSTQPILPLYLISLSYCTNQNSSMPKSNSRKPSARGSLSVPLSAQQNSSLRLLTPETRLKALPAFLTCSKQLSQSQISPEDYQIVDVTVSKKGKFEYLGVNAESGHKKYFTRKMLVSSDVLFGNLLAFYRQMAQDIVTGKGLKKEPARQYSS